ncbi:hypothetical protein K470DRAFT_259931 [Piedraia hortae CBS 480.64]|uniref:SWIM-type domain-containing protein n=1 Tax=Piedraia hortae CBS 480.64 TaxID=1314780 RepID=A0A6A7BT80_9PEZI|nr:hypothetical protein K470DRAFT_259931 [Piedraia hortae CBS 480.64]
MFLPQTHPGRTAFAKITRYRDLVGGETFLVEAEDPAGLEQLLCICRSWASRSKPFSGESPLPLRMYRNPCKHKALVVQLRSATPMSY